MQQSSISIASLFLPELKTIQYALHFLRLRVLVGMTDSIFSPFAMSAFENSLLLFCVCYAKRNAYISGETTVDVEFTV